MISCLFQAILAGAFANKDYEKAEATASRVLQVLYNVEIFPYLSATN